MKKPIITGLVLALFVWLLPGCCIKHTYINANCETPIICENCGKTQGKPLGHDWQDASCLAPKTCSRCGLTEGKTLDHKWTAAICIAPKTCILCAETEGEPLGHNYRNWAEVDEETMERLCPVCSHKETAPIDRATLLGEYLAQTRWIGIYETTLADISQKYIPEERMDVIFEENANVAIRMGRASFPRTWDYVSFERLPDDDEYVMQCLQQDGSRIDFTLFKDTSGEKPDYLFLIFEGRIVCYIRYTTERAGTWVPKEYLDYTERTGKLPGGFVYIREDGTVVLEDDGELRAGLLYDVAGYYGYGAEEEERDHYFEIVMEDQEVILLIIMESGDAMLCDHENNKVFLTLSTVDYQS